MYILPPQVLTPVTINSVSNFPSGADVTGTSVTNGITYNVYAFRTTGTTYTVNYSCASATQIYVLAVGGGGAGGGYTGAGGGAGGVVMMPVNLPSTSGTINTITVTIGAGGASNTSTYGQNGFPSTVTFTGNNSLNIYAGGGNGGGSYTGQNTVATGSSGGNSGYPGATPFNYTTNNISNGYNYTNYGGGGYVGSTESGGGGGGGAGTPGILGTGNLTSGDVGGNGGSGIQCFLPGITNFSPSGTSYGTFYWGGGGGGTGTRGT